MPIADTRLLLEPSANLCVRQLEKKTMFVGIGCCQPSGDDSLCRCYHACGLRAGSLFATSTDVTKDTDAAFTRKESDVLRQLRALLKVLFYGIAFVMALIKLVLALINSP
jgi:hypothetical protein